MNETLLVGNLFSLLMTCLLITKFEFNKDFQSEIFWSYYASLTTTLPIAENTGGKDIFWKFISVRGTSRHLVFIFLLIFGEAGFLTLLQKFNAKVLKIFTLLHLREIFASGSCSNISLDT